MWEPKRIAWHLPRSRGEIVRKAYTVVKGGGFSDMDVGDRPEDIDNFAANANLFYVFWEFSAIFVKNATFF